MTLTEGNFVAELNYGAALARAGRTEEALARYGRAIAFNPGYSDARFNLAVNLDRLGRTEAAREAYLEILRRDPRHAARPEQPRPAVRPPGERRGGDRLASGRLFGSTRA